MLVVIHLQHPQLLEQEVVEQVLLEQMHHQQMLVMVEQV
tara:strand:+ start:251 stop:367 length:117 start_codon:yes stop_codon:yes gene_type:complete